MGIVALSDEHKLFEAIVLLGVGGLMSILCAVYVFKIIKLISMLKKFTQSEDYYDKL